MTNAIVYGYGENNTLEAVLFNLEARNMNLACQQWDVRVIHHVIYRDFVAAVVEDCILNNKLYCEGRVERLYTDYLLECCSK